MTDDIGEMKEEAHVASKMDLQNLSVAIRFASMVNIKDRLLEEPVIEVHRQSHPPPVKKRKPQTTTGAIHQHLKEPPNQLLTCEQLHHPSLSLSFKTSPPPSPPQLHSLSVHGFLTLLLFH
ncbi:hypothetical protein RJT34_06504 [Clitoria ternatea]|uniref:Uncharacterized protein n=1 Tax=Clitoria ternatea TaxID=43366 RepID=A0AAN9K4W4_CLITE